MAAGRKYRHTSLIDIISATFLNKEEVLGKEIMGRFCFDCHMCKRNYERTGGRMEVTAVLSFFSAVRFISKVFITQSILVMGQQSLPEGVCREALWSKHICIKTRMHSSCTEKNGNKSKETYERKDRYNVACWQTSWM